MTEFNIDWLSFAAGFVAAGVTLFCLIGLVVVFDR